MRAKCKVCGTPLDTKTSYKVITFDKNKKEKRAYYCSKEEFETHTKEKEKIELDKDKVYRLVCEIIERKEITNTILFAEWKVWNKVADNEKIGQYLSGNKAYLCKMISRLDDKEYNRIRYLSAILKNSLGDYKPIKEVPKQVITTVQEEHYETKFKQRTRKSLADLEEDCDDE